MGWAETVFKNFRLYAVTDLRTEGAEILRKIEQAYRGGADIVQLRSKMLTDAALVRLGIKIQKIAQQHRKLFIVNDRVDLALACGAHGVHLGQEDLPIEAARKICRRADQSLFIGRSTHRLAQALEAERQGADYIGVGPVFSTPTKPGVPCVGLKFVRQAAARVSIPWVAIGGIDPNNLSDVVAAGARRVAVVRAIFSSKNSARAAQALQQQLKEASYGKNA